MSTDDQPAIYQRPVEILQRLVQFDTTNPPGDEAACIGYIRDLLSAAGIESTLVSRDPARPNLVARLSGRGEAAPLLMYGHVDVVTTGGQRWTHPPFGGEIADGCVWGRGALDMKGGVAMMLAALLRAKAAGLAPAGDVVFAALADEENGGDFGAKYVVESRPDLFAGVRYAIGEFGGFSYYAGGRKAYLVQVAEKQMCSLRATIRGRGGHGSMPVRGGAMAKLARVLAALDGQRLPVHVTTVARQMIEAMSAGAPPPQAAALRALLDPALADRVLDQMGPSGMMFDALLHNTVSPTILQGSTKINVIPSEVTLDMDGRLLPGFGPEDMLAELRALLGGAGEDVDLEVIRFDSGPAEPDFGFFGVLSEILRERDPEAVALPLLLSGVTDARFFSQLGIQSYGFTPMDLPDGFDFIAAVHAGDERVPVAAIEFGADAIYRLIEWFR